MNRKTIIAVGIGSVIAGGAVAAVSHVQAERRAQESQSARKLLTAYEYGPDTQKIDGLIAAERYDEAVAACNIFLQDEPSRACIYKCRGDVRHKQGNLLAAIKDYTAAIDCLAMKRKAWDHDFFLGDCLSGRAVCYIEQGDMESALADLNQVLAKSPKNASALNNRGVIRERLGDYAEAMEDYQAARTIDPVEIRYQSNLARVARKFSQ